MFTDPTQPNLTDFTTFVREQGITPVDLPDNSDYLTWAFDRAVNTALLPPADMPALLYVVATYNLGTHSLVKLASGAFFQNLRSQFNLLSFQAGPVVSSGDQGTNQTLAEPEFLKGLTISSLDLIKTPWGREYLDYAQQYGPNIVGVS